MKILNKINLHKDEIIQWFVIISFAFIVILNIMYNSNDAKDSIKKKRLYNVGILSGSSRSKSGSSVHYIYRYKGKIYEGKFSGTLNSNRIGERRLIVFNPVTNNKFLLPYVIKDCINETYNGWKKVPYNISENDIFEYLDKKL